jgi:hypothetical protein
MLDEQELDGLRDKQKDQEARSLVVARKRYVYITSLPGLCLARGTDTTKLQAEYRQLTVSILTSYTLGKY